jgi:hypothetical protein
MNKTIPQLAKDFFDSAIEFAATGFQVTSINELEKRLEICHKCEFFESKWFAGTGRCSKCGCSIQVKLRMAASTCPINKWLPVNK